MAILITGGTGFLGSHVARHLVEREQEVVLYDLFPAHERIADIRERVALVEGDVRDVSALTATIAERGVDRIAHLAFMPGTARPDRIVDYVELTCVGTATVFDAARLAGVTRIANASSMAVYGARTDEAGEDDPVDPVTLYGISKRWTEQLGDLYGREHGLEVLSLRVCATMGFGRLRRASAAAGLMGEERPHFMAYPELAARGEPVTMPPDDQPTEFLYAADAAEAFWLALTVVRPDHSVFNLTAGRRPVGDLTRHLRRLLPDARIDVAVAPVPSNPLLRSDRIRQELGFEPRFDLERAVEAYLEQVRTAS